MIEEHNFFDDFKKYYNNDDVEGCVSCLIHIMIDYNSRISIENAAPHELKHLLFQTNCIKNPMGMKYSEKDYKNTIAIFSSILKMIREINDPNADTSEHFDPSLVIDESIYNDFLDILVYTEVIYKMNAVNSKRMDFNEFSQQPFIVQLLTSVLFYQDQYRLLEKEYNVNLVKEYITGMELSIANRPVSHCDDIKASYADSMEINLTAIDEIVRFLYYKFKNKLKSNIDIKELADYDIKPYNNAAFARYSHIAIQRHLLQHLEEEIRCGFITFERVSQDTEGNDVYVFTLENVNKSHARFCGIYRREQQFRTRILFDRDAQKSLDVSNKFIPKLAEELINVQDKDFISFDLSNYHVDKEDYGNAQKIADTKINIFLDITKKYYLQSEVKGVKISDLLTCYRFLHTIAEIIKCAASNYEYESAEDDFLKEICLVETKYLCTELARLNDFDSDYASLLIDRFVFHDSNNRFDDVFAQPLIRISENQIVFCPALIDQVNLDRAIERQFIRFKVNIAKIGTDFEALFKDTLTAGYKESPLDLNTHPIPHLSVNSNPIKYTAYDGKDIEFDVVMVLGNYLILTELKAIMTSYDLTDLIEREQNITEAIKQLKRRKESVIKDWSAFRSYVSIELPEKPFNPDRILLVACSDAYDFTPLQVGEVFITDESTYLRYFTNPCINLIEKNSLSASFQTKRFLWSKGYPTAEEFMNYLRCPTTTQYIDKLIKTNYLPIPCFDKEDLCIAIAECQLPEDPTVNMAKPTTGKKKISKNTRCPCGSGKKFKKCCKGKGIYD